MSGYYGQGQLVNLAELSYRCTLCRRCAQTCPIGVDNGLITREIRKLFSQELGWAPRELHEKGTVLQLEVGSSTGMTPMIVKDNIEFIDEDTAERTGIPIERLGTKCPSITSRWIQSAPAPSTAATSEPRREKSADRIDGAIRTGRVMRRFLHGCGQAPDGPSP